MNKTYPLQHSLVYPTNIAQQACLTHKEAQASSLPTGIPSNTDGHTLHLCPAVPFSRPIPLTTRILLIYFFFSKQQSLVLSCDEI